MMTKSNVNHKSDTLEPPHATTSDKRPPIQKNICRKVLGHLMKFTQRSIPYRFGLGLSTAFYRLGLSTSLVKHCFETGQVLLLGWVDAMCTLIISLPSNKSSVIQWLVNGQCSVVAIWVMGSNPLTLHVNFFSFKLKRLALS